MHKKKILITGFPHTGTSILKSKLGECTNVYELLTEGDVIHNNHLQEARENEFVLTKSPVIPINIRANDVNLIRAENSTYKDYILIFVTRNPYYLFTSVIKSGGNPMAVYEPFSKDDPIRVEQYLASLKIMKDIKEKNISDTYTIRYEDFFDNDSKAIKDIMDSIGLNYSNDIFEKRTKDYTIAQGVNYKDIDVSKITYEDNKLAYRIWQINQPFENMNGNVNIPAELDAVLKNAEILQYFGYSDPRVTD